MTRTSRLGLVLAALSLGPAPAGASTPVWRKVEATPGFTGWRQELQRVADRDGRVRRNTFCIVVHQADPQDVTAVVYWKEGRRLSAYGRSDEPMSGLTHSGATLDLRRDLVASEDQIGGSTYRETRAWAAERIAACRRFGAFVTILRSR